METLEEYLNHRAISKSELLIFYAAVSSLPVLKSLNYLTPNMFDKHNRNVGYSHNSFASVLDTDKQTRELSSLFGSGMSIHMVKYPLCIRIVNINKQINVNERYTLIFRDYFGLITLLIYDPELKECNFFMGITSKFALSLSDWVPVDIATGIFDLFKCPKLSVMCKEMVEELKLHLLLTE